MINFSVPFVQGKGRPRFRVFKGFAQVFTPKETQIAEKEIRKAAKPFFPTPLVCQVEVKIVYYLYRNTRTISRGPRKGTVETKIPRKIDTDNVTKLVKDALNGLAYEDDFQVRKDICEYFFVDSKEKEKTEVTIIPLTTFLDSEQVD